MRFQICTDNLETFIKILNEMKNGRFFAKPANCAWEGAWPLFCTRLKGAADSSQSRRSKQFCAAIKQLFYASTGMQRGGRLKY